MHVRALASLGLCVALLLGALAIAVPSRAAFEKPVWRVGDFWEYAITGTGSPLEADGTMRLQVLGTETIVVGGVNYASYHLDMDMNVTSGGFTINVPGEAWYRTSDLASVRMTMTMSFFGQTMTMTVSYDPPPPMEWPLTPGGSWSVLSTARMVTEATGMPPQYANTTLSGTVTVLANETRTVTAGAFTATPVRLLDVSEAYTISYWSEDAGNFVEQDSFDSSDVETGSVELKSYEYTKPTSGGTPTGPTGAEGFLGLSWYVWAAIAAVAVILAAVAMVLVRRRRPRMPAPMQAMPPSGPPTQPPPEPPASPPPGSTP